MRIYVIPYLNTLQENQGVTELGVNYVPPRVAPKIIYCLLTL